MADLEAVLADVSYLMAMEKSKEKCGFRLSLLLTRSQINNIWLLRRFSFLPSIIDKITDVLKSLWKQTSVNSVKNGRRLTLPDRDSTNVIKRLLSENNKLDFDERVQYDFLSESFLFPS